jgi:hypothetical protein
MGLVREINQTRRPPPQGNSRRHKPNGILELVPRSQWPARTHRLLIPPEAWDDGMIEEDFQEKMTTLVDDIAKRHKADENKMAKLWGRHIKIYQNGAYWHAEPTLKSLNIFSHHLAQIRGTSQKDAKKKVKAILLQTAKDYWGHK